MNDVDLIARIRSGDENACRILVENNKNLVWHMVLRMINQPEDAEDICQDVFLNVFRNIGNFKGGSKLSSWIGSIAYHVCIDYLRKKGKEKSLFLCAPVADNRYDPTMLLPSGNVDRARLKALVHQLIEHLPVSYRTVVTLYHLEECSYREIADITGLPEGTVKSYLSRAREIIREQVVKRVPDIRLVLFEN